ncbi:MAG: 50S ribosomal protein L3 [Candidatus Sungbacteria bacterium]|nr:50S ribosomal protein L3 [Candidatus Sungbacteria bacterium]
MKFLLGKKLGMSQVFAEDGSVEAVTLIESGPMKVIRQKTDQRDGYRALVFGFGLRKAKRVARAQKGEWRNLGNFEVVREGRGMSGRGRGKELDVGQFKAGDIVKVSGVSKAKGFQGVVKRHGFHGAPKTHGTKHAHRQPGSIGATWPQRVIKGRRMAGRMGGERVTVRNLKVVKVDPERQLIAVGGAVPGRRGTLIEIRG